MEAKGREVHFGAGEDEGVDWTSAFFVACLLLGMAICAGVLVMGARKVRGRRRKLARSTTPTGHGHPLLPQAQCIGDDGVDGLSPRLPEGSTLAPVLGQGKAKSA